MRCMFPKSSEDDAMGKPPETSAIADKKRQKRLGIVLSLIVIGRLYFSEGPVAATVKEIPPLGPVGQSALRTGTPTRLHAQRQMRCQVLDRTVIQPRSRRRSQPLGRSTYFGLGSRNRCSAPRLLKEPRSQLFVWFAVSFDWSPFQDGSSDCGPSPVFGLAVWCKLSCPVEDFKTSLPPKSLARSH